MTPLAILTRVKGLRTVLLALSVSAVLAAPAPAPAQDDEVYINPDSPSGVEYDLPLERARRDADPAREASADVARQSQSAAPFGTGVEPSEDGTTGARQNREAGDAKAKANREARDSTLPPEVAAAAAQPVPPVDSSGSTPIYAGLGALIVALGGVIGLLLRRRRDEG